MLFLLSAGESAEAGQLVVRPDGRVGRGGGRRVGHLARHQQRGTNLRPEKQHIVIYKDRFILPEIMK